MQLIDADKYYCNAKLQYKITPSIIRKILGNMITDSNFRLLVGPFIKRLFFCSKTDVDQLNFLLKMVPPFLNNNRPSDNDNIILSTPLFNNIVLSEMLTLNNDRPTPNELNCVNSLYFTLSQAKFASEGLSQNWPTYALDNYHNQYAEIKVPFMLVSGELDPQTSYGASIRGFLTYNAQKKKFYFSALRNSSAFSV